MIKFFQNRKCLAFTVKSLLINTSLIWTPLLTLTTQRKTILTNNSLIRKPLFTDTTTCRHLPNMDSTPYRHLCIIASSHLLTKLFYFILKHIKNDDGNDYKTKQTKKQNYNRPSLVWATDTKFQQNWANSNNLTSIVTSNDNSLMLNTSAFQSSYGNFAMTFLTKYKYLSNRNNNYLPLPLCQLSATL